MKMKKIIGCPAGEWAKKLYTVDRFEKLAYLLDNEEGEFEAFSEKEIKHIYRYDHLKNEDKNSIIIIINDTRKYQDIKEKLESYGLQENKHFFNGWKLDSSFYAEVYGDKEWKDFEKEDVTALSRQREGWKKRAEFMASMIPDDITSIMDIGCGEGLIKEYLPKNVKYYGVDYCMRDEKTLICDINNESLPDKRVDLYYMAGVIDYVIDVKKFIIQLKQAKYVLISKTRNERFIRLDDKIVDEGYMNYGIAAYYIADLITDMYKEGLACKKMVWDYKSRDEYYLLFENLNYTDNK